MVPWIGLVSSDRANDVVTLPKVSRTHVTVRLACPYWTALYDSLDMLNGTPENPETMQFQVMKCVQASEITQIKPFYCLNHHPMFAL